MNAKTASPLKSRHYKENPARRAVMDDAVSKMEAIYRQERNPIYVWWAIRVRHRRGGEIPDWCLEYLDGCAEAIDNLANDLEKRPQFITPDNFESPIILEKTAKSPANKAADAFRVFGFLRRGWNAFERFSSRQQNASIAAALHTALERVKLRKQADKQTAEEPIKKRLAKQVVDDLVRSTGLSRTRLYDRAAKEKDSRTPASPKIRKQTLSTGLSRWRNYDRARHLPPKSR